MGEILSAVVWGSVVSDLTLLVYLALYPGRGHSTTWETKKSRKSGKILWLQAAGPVVLSGRSEGLAFWQVMGIYEMERMARHP